MGYHRNPESRITQAQQRRRRGMSFRVHFLLIDLENALHALEYFEALRDAALPCTEAFVSADDWCVYYSGQAARVRRELAAARAEETGGARE